MNTGTPPAPQCALFPLQMSRALSVLNPQLLHTVCNYALAAGCVVFLALDLGALIERSSAAALVGKAMRDGTLPLLLLLLLLPFLS